jgi:hypothetical protein
MQQYVELLNSRIFGDPDWKAIQSSARGKPRVHLRLNAEFNTASSFVVHELITSLYNLYGKRIEPLNIKDGCISLDLKFDSEKDIHGNDFRDLITNSQAYQNILKSFKVQFITFQGWHANRFYNAYAVDRQGHPEPILGAMPR